MRENEHFSSFGEEEERKGVVAAARKEDGEKQVWEEKAIRKVRNKTFQTEEVRERRP